MNNPTKELGPEDTLMAGGYDFAWCYVIFKEVPGYPAYRVSSEGELWSSLQWTKRTVNSKWNRNQGAINDDGYIRVLIKNNEGSKSFRLHRLIMRAFHGEPASGMLACHNNGIRHDNRLANLRWGTPRENAYDRRRHGTHTAGSQIAISKIREEDIPVILEMALDGTFQKDIGARFGVGPTQITRILTGEHWSHVSGITRSDYLAHGGYLRKKLSDDDHKEIARLRQNGLSLKEIAAKFKVHRVSILRRLQKMGIGPPNPKRQSTT